MRFLLSRTRPTNPYRTHCDMLLPLDIFFCDMGLGELETVLPILIGFFLFSLYVIVIIFLGITRASCYLYLPAKTKSKKYPIILCGLLLSTEEIEYSYVIMPPSFIISRGS